MRQRASIRNGIIRHGVAIMGSMAMTVSPHAAPAPIQPGLAHPALAHPRIDDPKLDVIPAFADVDPSEPAPDSTLADAIARAYRTNPALQARRYDLRATDETLGSALSELRPTTALQVIGQYSKTVPGRTTQSSRLFAASPIITANTLTAQAIVTQPVYTGGKATADIAAARAAMQAGRAGLTAAEGDLLLQTITAYMDVRLATRSLLVRQANLDQFKATLTEVRERRAAGELTQTDVSQTETQVKSAEMARDDTRLQLAEARANYAALVGSNAGNLAPEPPLPQLPDNIEDAIAQAEEHNPDLAQASYNEVASRHRIGSARAANHPTVSLQGSAQLTGQGAPFYLDNQDQTYLLQGVLTIPLTSGGHNGAAIAQAEATNSADMLRIEATRRGITQNILTAWNQMTTARRNLRSSEDQVKSAAIFYEGSLAEYRAGVRSTFDVLYAQEILVSARIQRLSSQRDTYVAEATLLRYVGALEVGAITTGIDLYDPSRTVRHLENRGATPWDEPFRKLDTVNAAGTANRPVDQPDTPHGPVLMAPAMGPPPPDRYESETPFVPQGGAARHPTDDATP